MSDSTNTILSSAKRFLGGTMLSRITGLLRDMAMASAFGTGAAVSALFLAFRFAHLFRRLLGEGALQTAFVPAFENLRKDDPKRATRFFKDLYAGLSALLLMIILISMGLIGLVLHYANLSTDNQEIAWLTFLMMPSLFFICLYGLNAGLLQCEKSFFTASFAPIAFNLIWILGVYCCRNSPYAMSGLACFIVLACLGQWLYTVPKTLGVLKKLGGRSSWNSIRLSSSDVRLVISPLLLGIIGIGASQINNALDSVFARYADVEGPAFLWYAIRLQQLPLALIGVAVSGAILPPLARAAKSEQFGKFRHFVEFALSRSIAPMIVITFSFFAMGDSIINLFWGHGAFGNESTAQTTLCLWAYTAGLIPMTIVLILAPALYSQNDYRTTTQASVFAMLMNLVLNAVLIFGCGLGAASVALATSVSAWFNVILLSSRLKNSIGSVWTASLVKNISKVALSSTFAMLAVFILDMILSEGTVIELLRGKIPHYSHHLIHQLFRLTIQSVSFLSVLGLSGWLLQAHDLIFFRAKSENPL